MRSCISGQCQFVILCRLAILFLGCEDNDDKLLRDGRHGAAGFLSRSEPDYRIALVISPISIFLMKNGN
jgi:hypothetical protein